MWKRVMAMLLCACLVTGMAGCGSNETVGGESQVSESVENNVSTENLADGDSPTELPVETPPADVQVMETVNLMDGVEPAGPDLNDVLPSYPITKFGLPLFQNVVKEAKEGENVLVSPLSAWTVLGMTEAGAAGDTRKQMRKVLNTGDHLSYLEGLTKTMEQDEFCKVHLANGIWFKNVNTLQVKESFLQYNKAFYDATAYKAPFNESTLQDINNWVSENTDGMILEILKEIEEKDVMYLVNALSFDAEWQSIYREDAIWNDIFTTENGEEQLVSMMHSDESLYLEDANATGFMKYYKGQNYAFVALLPKEGVTVAEYVEGLTAESLNELLAGKSHGSVEVTMPKFSVEYGITLNDSLQRMGMTDAFDEDNADFSEMATSDIGNIYISKVDQKCFIAVDERGTRAGASTVVAMANKMMAMDKKVVNLNRPFVYMIIECEHNEPLFIGTMMDVEQ